MSEVSIRLAHESDLDAIYRLEVAAFPAPWRREFFASELHASNRLNLVALSRQEVIGYLFAMWFFDEMHVNKIAVESRERRKGIAARLMEDCFDFAKLNRVRTISLEVRQSNTGAQEFYTQLDFEATYIRSHYYPDGEAAVVMTKVLPSV